jgi:hypothetical protein
MGADMNSCIFPESLTIVRILWAEREGSDRMSDFGIESTLFSHDIARAEITRTTANRDLYLFNLTIK